MRACHSDRDSADFAPHRYVRPSASEQKVISGRHGTAALGPLNEHDVVARAVATKRDRSTPQIRTLQPHSHRRWAKLTLPPEILRYRSRLNVGVGNDPLATAAQFEASAVQMNSMRSPADTTDVPHPEEDQGRSRTCRPDEYISSALPLSYRSIRRFSTSFASKLLFERLHARLLQVRYRRGAQLTSITTINPPPPFSSTLLFVV